MALVNVDAEKAAVAAVKTFDTEIMPDLPELLDKAAKSFARELGNLFVGKTITVTTTIKVE